MTRAATRTLLVEKDAGGSVLSRVRRTVLPSGLRIVTEPMPGVRSASIGVWVGVGSRDEAPTVNGACHFLEHLLFKGTRERSGLDISAAMDAVGGEFNAFTAKEYTCFHARVLDEDLPLAIDVLGDMLTSSTLTEADVEAEREVILDEIAMHDDDPEDVVTNLFAQAAYGDSALGRAIAGTTTTIEALTRSQVRSFWRRRFIPASMVVSVAGNVDHADVVRRVRASFGRAGFLESAAKPAAPRRAARFRSAAGGRAKCARPFEQANLVLGYDALDRHDDRRYTMGVLNAVVGGGPSSRLFQEVRERRGLAYSIYSFTSHHADAGSFCVGAGCLPNRLDEVLTVVRGELASVAADGITEEELRRGKGQLRGGLVLGLEDSASRMSRIGKAELLYGDLPGVDEILRRVDAVTIDEVHALAAEVFGHSETLAVVAPR